MAERKSTRKVKRSGSDGYMTSKIRTPKKGSRTVHSRHVGKASPTGSVGMPGRRQAPAKAKRAGAEGPKRSTPRKKK